MCIFLDDFIIMAFERASRWSSTMISGSYLFIIGLAVIIIAIRYLFMDLKHSKFYIGLIIIALSSVIIIVGFSISEDLFLAINLWGYSIFANLMAELLLVVGTFSFLGGLVILFEGIRIAKLFLGLILIILGIILSILGFIFLVPYISYFYLLYIYIYIMFGIVLIILGIVIIITKIK